VLVTSAASFFVNYVVEFLNAVEPGVLLILWLVKPYCSHLGIETGQMLAVYTKMCKSCRKKYFLWKNMIYSMIFISVKLKEVKQANLY
jgi:hypothetical protein